MATDHSASPPASPPASPSPSPSPSPSTSPSTPAAASSQASSQASNARRLADAIGRVGIWTTALRARDPARLDAVTEAAREIERLGYGALWLGGSPGIDAVEPLLTATSRMSVASGILSIWEHEPATVAARYARVDAECGGRFVLGLGVSHPSLTDGYRRPLAAMRDYLDALDVAPEPVPAGRRVLAALGPRMLDLARERAAGAHPYLVTREHTTSARSHLGPDAVLAPEMKAVLDPDLDRALATARGYASSYLGMPNYTRNLLRLGFTEDDFREGGSDRLIDELFALGDRFAIRDRVNEFLAAGADHVALQVVTDDPITAIPMDAYRDLSEVLAPAAA